MVTVERELSGFQLAPGVRGATREFKLVSGPNATFAGFEYALTFPLPNAVRVTLTGPDRPAPPHDNVILPAKPVTFAIKHLDEEKCEAVIPFPAPASKDLDKAGRKREVRLNWADSILLSIWEEVDGAWVRLTGDLPSRSYALTEHGVMRHWWLERDNVHLGMGEKAAPLDLTGRSFRCDGSDSAAYDAYESMSGMGREADISRPAVQAHAVPRIHAQSGRGQADALDVRGVSCDELECAVGYWTAPRRSLGILQDVYAGLGRLGRVVPPRRRRQGNHAHLGGDRGPADACRARLARIPRQWDGARRERE